MSWQDQDQGYIATKTVLSMLVLYIFLGLCYHEAEITFILLLLVLAGRGWVGV